MPNDKNEVVSNEFIDQNKLALKLGELEIAFDLWQNEAEKKGAVFNGQWLRNNGFRNLLDWFERNGGIKLLINKSTNEKLKNSFNYEEKSEKYTLESALIKLEEAFAKWQDLPEEKRVRFNTNWLYNNGFEGVYQWAWRAVNGGIQSLVAQSTNVTLKQNFEYTKKSEKYTLELALARLDEAFTKWQENSIDGKIKFNMNWLNFNGYRTLVRWALKNGGMLTLINTSQNIDLKNSFEYEEKSDDYTLESALIKLEEAFIKWQTTPTESRGIFNSKWMYKNGFSGLCGWVKAIGGIQSLVAQSANVELKQNFVYEEKSEKYTLETALPKLEQAFAQWQKQQKQVKSVFNLRWLTKNGFSGLRNWAYREVGSLAKLLELSKNEIMKDSFEYEEKSEKYTLETALLKLEQAFAQWQSQPEKERKKFNTTWLKANGFSGLCKSVGQVGGFKKLLKITKVTGLKEAFRFGHKQEKILNEEQELTNTDQYLPNQETDKSNIGGVLPSEMVDLLDLGTRLEVDIIVADLESRKSGQFTDSPDQTLLTAEPNPLQKLRFSMAQARQTGVWDRELIEQYIELHSFLPDYLFHHLGVDHIILLARAGKIQLPNSVLSIGGGAFGELIAWKNKLGDASPMVYNFDSSPEILELSPEKLASQHKISRNDFNGVVGDMKNFKNDYLANFQVGDFDLLECSSLDNLSDLQVPKFVEEVIDVVKPGQLIQFVHRKPIPDTVWKILENMNCEILTSPGAKLDASLGNLLGNKATKERVKRKLREGGGFYLLARKLEKKQNSQVDENVKFIEHLERAKSLPHNELSLLLLDLARFYPNYADIPETELTKIGFKREIIKINKKGASNVIRIVRI